MLGWPTAVFVALALDHVVANMFFMPLYVMLYNKIVVPC